MTLELVEPVETLKPAELPQTLRFSLGVGHSSRLQVVSEHSGVLVIDNIRMWSYGHAVLLPGRCTYVVVL
jgi:hypothetical protein